jgi:hypothetical protein
MTLVPVAAGARLLGIHPKTLRHWLTAAAFPLAAHPSDARLKCVAEEHLLALATQHGRPLSALAPLLMPQSDAASAFAAAHLNPPPAEVRARSRVTALLEYGAHGQYVAVCPKLGVLSLTPDSPQWFDWLASLTSFRGCRAQQGALRRVVPPTTGSTPAVGLPGACFMGTTAGTLLGSPTVSHAPRWNRRRLSFKLEWTRSE